MPRGTKKAKEKSLLAPTKMGRKTKEIDLNQLKTLMRLKPTQADVAAFFEVDDNTIDRIIKKNWGLTFGQFRDQNMVHTRFSLIREAIKQATGGNTAMLIFCLKNLCGWTDRVAMGSAEDLEPFKLAYEVKKRDVK